ncbi:CPBP family intramembrane glutamic endopeptidase [Thalassobacillus hwangdonensis]|uniref:CPBP family intramembrane glutamic endopeptidase n=1 Tax=Thalassobacillus hwangdonensis TaxID=546108 RepID=A0ABW3KXX9_9BACI
MSRKSQSELIKNMSDKEILFHLLLTQLIIFIIAMAGSWLLFDSFLEGWSDQFTVDAEQIFVYGVLPGFLIVGLDLLLMKLLPEKYYDDGGINERVFSRRSVGAIFLLAGLVSVSEELLFRGVIQTQFGYIFASTLFAIIHIRYLKKIVLFVSVLSVSFFIGYMYEITGNIIVTITAHFIIDVSLALVIRFKK